MLFRFDGREPTFGVDTYISETAIVVGDVRLGSSCYVGHGAILRGDYGTILAEDGVIIEEGAIIHAPPEEICHIGKNVIIGHGAIVHASILEELVVVGMGSILSLRSIVRKGSIVAEGAVVKRGDVLPEGGVYGGNPARKIRDVKEEERAYFLFANRLYRDLAKRYLERPMEPILPEKREGP